MYKYHWRAYDCWMLVSLRFVYAFGCRFSLFLSFVRSCSSSLWHIFIYLIASIQHWSAPTVNGTPFPTRFLNRNRFHCECISYYRYCCMLSMLVSFVFFSFCSLCFSFTHSFTVSLSFTAPITPTNECRRSPWKFFFSQNILERSSLYLKYRRREYKTPNESKALRVCA